MVCDKINYIYVEYASEMNIYPVRMVCFISIFTFITSEKSTGPSVGEIKKDFILVDVYSIGFYAYQDAPFDLLLLSL